MGDYADSLSKQVGKGGSIDAKHWEALNSLYQQSMELNQELQGMQYKVAQNNFYFGELVRQVRKNLQNNPDNLAQSDFQVLDQRMQRYPALIYDGPFSEHLERTEPRDLSGLAEVGPGEAQHKALSFIDGKQGVDYQAAVTGSAEGRIPAYRVEVSPAGGSDSEKYVMDISKKGGKLVWMINSRPVGNQSIDINSPAESAGLPKEQWFRRYESNLFPAAEIRQHLISRRCRMASYYIDLIKVTVALDNGKLQGRNIRLPDVAPAA